MNLANVIVIDDDPFVRSTLKAGLAHYGINVKVALPDGSLATKCLDDPEVTVAVVDLDLGPGPSGIDICLALRMKKPDIGLVLLTSYQDPRIHDPNAPSLPKGCRFVSKSDLEEFQVLVNGVLSAQAKPLQLLKYKWKQKVHLTTSQLEVLKMIAQGMTSQEIATLRGVSLKAVENMIVKIQRQAGLSKSKSLNQRVSMARYYYRISGKKAPGE